jgi:hypothetical protein
MSPLVKFLIGLVAVLLMGWTHYGPLGNGAVYIVGLERQAAAAVAKTEVPGIRVSLGRDPLSRVATLSGDADPFQRNGQGSLKGLNDVVGEIEGVSRVQWADENPAAGFPLLLESLLPILLAYLLGVGIAWLFWGRERREEFY